jgi:hypothetical protein
VSYSLYRLVQSFQKFSLSYLKFDQYPTFIIDAVVHAAQSRYIKANASFFTAVNFVAQRLARRFE